MVVDSIRFSVHIQLALDERGVEGGLHLPGGAKIEISDNPGREVEISGLYICQGRQGLWPARHLPDREIEDLLGTLHLSGMARRFTARTSS